MSEGTFAWGACVWEWMCVCIGVQVKGPLTLKSSSLLPPWVLVQIRVVRHPWPSAFHLPSHLACPALGTAKTHLLRVSSPLRHVLEAADRQQSGAAVHRCWNATPPSTALLSTQAAKRTTAFPSWALSCQQTTPGPSFQSSGALMP